MRIIGLLVFVLFLFCCALKTPLSAIATADGKYWIVKEPLIYEHPRTKRTFVVPRGFVTDLTSVPRLFWTAFPPCGKYTPAAVVHDYIYWYQPPDCDQKCADDLLMIAMDESGVGKTTREAIYAGVRFGGEKAWDGNRMLRESGTIRCVPEEFMNIGPYDTWADIEARIKSESNNLLEN